MSLHLDVTVRRGDLAESSHTLHAAVVDTSGRLQLSAGDPRRDTTFRSAAKPFQLLPLVERGHAERWGFGDEQLAVMAASHTGSAQHIALVRGILERIGLTADALACGAHEPSDPDSLTRYRDFPAERGPLYNNCSGKHAGMLCLALSEGWPTEGYHRPEHPVQRLMRQTVADVCGVLPESMGLAIDGCSVPVFSLPLEAMARGYAVLAAARPGGDTRERSLDRIRGAMTAFPVAVEGTGRLSTTLMQTTRGRLVAKGGAEGLQLVGLVDRGVGVAVRCEDGSARAVSPGTCAVLERLRALEPSERESLASYARPELSNVAGAHVGWIEAAWGERADLESPDSSGLAAGRPVP